MMKIQKKYIFLTLGFLFFAAIIYIIVLSYFSNNLNFKEYYSLQNTTESIEYDKVSYVVDDDKIVYVEKNNDTFSFNYFTKEDLEAKKITSFELKDVYNYSFIVKGNFYYFFYNNNNNFVSINKQTYVNNHYTNLLNGQKIFNDFDGNLYVYNDSKLWSIKLEDNNFSSSLFYTLPSEITQIKTVDFISKDKLLVSTYNAKLYIINTINNTKYESQNNYQEYCRQGENVYYTYAIDDKKLGIGIIKDNQEKTFSIKNVDYLSMKIVDDYIYLLNEKFIYKVSISREKRHETLELSEYVDSTFSLLNVIIVKDDLMYLPLIKKVTEGVNPYYKYCLYKYEL